MKTFQDAKNRTWTIELNLGTAMQVKQHFAALNPPQPVDLLTPEDGDPPLITRIGIDEYLLAEIICVLIQPQFEKANITEAEVRLSFDGRTMLGAQKAFYDELTDFFQSRGRTDRAKAVAKHQALIENAIALVERKVDAIDVDDKISGAMSGLSPEQSA